MSFNVCIFHLSTFEDYWRVAGLGFHFFVCILHAYFLDGSNTSQAGIEDIQAGNTIYQTQQNLRFCIYIKDWGNVFSQINCQGKYEVTTCFKSSFRLIDTCARFT